MQGDGWHLGLRAWNGGVPPFPNQPPLTPAEQELTAFFVQLQSTEIAVALTGPNGTLLDRLVKSCPAVIAQVDDGVMAQAAAATASPALEPLEVLVLAELEGIGGALRLLSPNDPNRRKPLTEAADLLADGAVAIERLMGACRLSAAVISSWIVAAAAHATAVTVIRERRANLPALYAAVTTASAAYPDGQAKLSTHIYADIVKAERRLGRVG